mmetsp:Transcript_2860/g.8725  ORF Transcript_2860/g.8725 Transcript_2860/m.8725 type:complete len:145 (-) Transcript_2860:1232-1666(-)
MADRDRSCSCNAGTLNSIWWAASQGDLPRVEAALQRRGDADARDDYGYTPLIYAARGGHTDVVRHLLESNADPNAQTLGGATALMRAAFAGHDEVVSLLLRSGSSPSLKDSDGLSGLQRLKSSFDASSSRRPSAKSQTSTIYTS